MKENKRYSDVGVLPPVYTTKRGKAYCGDSFEVMKSIRSGSVSLVITSPPFALRHKKAYGNVTAEKYVEWFWPFAREIHRILKNDGSLVLDIGGAWNRGVPTRSLYQFELLLSLCGTGFFRLAQDFYWYNRSKIPAPAEWVTIRRIRVKDAVNPVWWLAKSEFPKASNWRVLQPYSHSMQILLKHGYNQGLRPSGHRVSARWSRDNGGSIATNLIEAANTRAADAYMNACREHDLPIHPARFVEQVPEFFIKFLTEPRDLILDPFAGSNIVGAVAERLKRRWVSIEIDPVYVVGSAFRFDSTGKKLLGKWRRTGRLA
jgi:site-specific DNA-methyltransferase (cytosine-N4-specific)